MKTMDVQNSMQMQLAKPAGPARGDREKFTELMRVSFDRQNGGSDAKEKQLKDAANQLVSVAFIKPMMAQMRESPFKNEMFHGGQGETVFQEHLDTVLADRVASRSRFSIADAIYRKIAKTAGMDVKNSVAPNTGGINEHG